MGGRGTRGATRAGGATAKASPKNGGLNRWQREAVQNYVAMSGPINHQLRNPNSKELSNVVRRSVAADVKHLDSLTRSNKLRGQTLYRGVEADSLSVGANLRVGQTARLDAGGFISTTTDKKSSFLKSRPINLVIRTKKTNTGLDMSKVGFAAEREVLLPRHSKSKVTRVVKTKGKTVVYGDLIQ